MGASRIQEETSRDHTFPDLAGREGAVARSGAADLGSPHVGLQAPGQSLGGSVRKPGEGHTAGLGPSGGESVPTWLVALGRPRPGISARAWELSFLPPSSPWGCFGGDPGDPGMGPLNAGPLHSLLQTGQGLPELWKDLRGLPALGGESSVKPSGRD